MNKEKLHAYSRNCETVLRTMIVAEQFYWLVADKLKPEHLLSYEQKELYSIIQRLGSQGMIIAWDSVASEVLKHKDKNIKNWFLDTDFSIIDAGTTNAAKTPEHFKSLVHELVEASVAIQSRNVMSEAMQIMDMDNYPMATLQEIILKLKNIEMGVLDQNDDTLIEVAQQFYDDMLTAKDRGCVGTSLFGIPVLDNLAFGDDGDLIIIAARPGQGKSSLQNSSAKHFIESGKKGLFWSLEMKKKVQYGRLVSAMTGIPYSQLVNREFPDSRLKDIEKVMEQINNSGIILEDKPGVSAMDIKARATSLMQKHKIEAIFIDRLGLMANLPGTASMNKVNKIAETTKMLRQMSSELGIPIIAHSQLNRQVENRPDRIPQLSDLRDSGAIEQDATKIIFLMRPDYYLKQGKNVEGIEEWDRVEDVGLAVLAKNTNGKTEKIKMKFNAPMMYFSSLEDEDMEGVEPIRMVNGVLRGHDDEIIF